MQIKDQIAAGALAIASVLGPNPAAAKDVSEVHLQLSTSSPEQPVRVTITDGLAIDTLAPPNLPLSRDVSVTFPPGQAATHDVGISAEWQGSRYVINLELRPIHVGQTISVQFTPVADVFDETALAQRIRQDCAGSASDLLGGKPNTSSARGFTRCSLSMVSRTAYPALRP